MNWLNKKLLGLFVKSNGLLSAPLLGGMGHIFMLHRVLPDALHPYIFNKGLGISPDSLEYFIQHFRSKNYDFISLDELSEILTKKRNPDKKFICFTLDDGYKDNLTYGLPVFSKYQVPFTIYVTNCFPNQTALLWWYMLEKALFSKSSLQLQTPQGVKNYAWQTDVERLSCYNQIRDEIRRIPKVSFRKSILDTFQLDEATIGVQNENTFLSWDEIIQLSQNPLVTIGAHTMNHLSLTSLSDEELVDEIKFSKDEIERYIQKEVAHFAYPYGGVEDAHAREYEVIKTLGFKTATLNRPGNVFPASIKEMECLPRMPLSGSSTKEKVDYILNGINHFSYNGFKKSYY